MSGDSNIADLAAAIKAGASGFSAPGARTDIYDLVELEQCLKPGFIIDVKPANRGGKRVHKEQRGSLGTCIKGM